MRGTILSFALWGLLLLALSCEKVDLKTLLFYDDPHTYMQVDGVLWSGIEESIYVLKSNGLVIDDDGFVMEMRRKLTDGKDTLQLCIHLKSDELLDVGKRFLCSEAGSRKL